MNDTQPSLYMLALVRVVFVGDRSDKKGRLTPDMPQRPPELPIRSAHGMANRSYVGRCWNGIGVYCVTTHSNPGKSWQSLASEQATVAVILEQQDGIAEPRKRLTHQRRGFGMTLAIRCTFLQTPTFGPSEIQRASFVACECASIYPSSTAYYKTSAIDRNGMNRFSCSTTGAFER